MTGGYHVPALEQEVLALLPTDPDGTYVDGTLGGGGHTRGLLARLGPRGCLIGLDRDPRALEEARELATKFSSRLRLLQGDYGDLRRILTAEGRLPVHGILLDLGVSSHQLDSGPRGFSFLRDGPLDMRMDPTCGAPAADLVNGLAEETLAKIFREYGEEPRARRVARAIALVRERQPIRTTAQLAEVVEKALGRRGPKHPATRVFQALRIATNQELESLDRFLADLPALLVPGGRVVVIAYHSLEDRRVKQALRALEPRCRCPQEAPRCSCGCPGSMRLLSRKAIKPQREEISRNPRARSARLRAAQRIAGPLDSEAPPGGRA